MKFLDIWFFLCTSIVFLTLTHIVFQHLIVTKRQNVVKDESGEQQIEDGGKQGYIKGGNKLEQKLNLWCKIIFPFLYTLAIVVLFLASF